ncbi:MAG: L-2-amino-thiazoline-4-carboxylic acid hydrolase [Cloacibacillus sp.]
MCEEKNKLPLIKQREIEMKVLGPVIRAFCDEFGTERTFDVVRNVMQEISRGLGRDCAEENGRGIASLAKNCLTKWNAGGELTMEKMSENDRSLSFDVTRCAYAELYQKLGFGDIGALVSCDRDAAFLEGFDDRLELVRAKTIMNGDDRCDFCYRKR